MQLIELHAFAYCLLCVYLSALLHLLEVGILDVVVSILTALLACLLTCTRLRASLLRTSLLIHLLRGSLHDSVEVVDVQFVRFQKAADGTFFAAFEPQYNALPLTVHHFKDRFADQKWIIYDMKRRYGFYYDLQEVTTVSFDDDSRESHLITGMLDESLMDKDEKLFQQLWKTYFKAICIKERMNPRKHRQDMPVRYWKYLTEKQK